MNDLAPRSNRLEALELRVAKLEKGLAALEAREDADYKEIYSILDRLTEGGQMDLKMCVAMQKRINEHSRFLCELAEISVNQSSFLWPERTPEFKQRVQLLMTRLDKPL